MSIGDSRTKHEPWSPDSWRTRPQAQRIDYPDAPALACASARLRELPPLVTSGEIEQLRLLLAQAERGERFILHGGDCAESFAECAPKPIADMLKVLLQMSLVLVHGLRRPVVRIGRLAGQYAKPRSSASETRNGVTLPSYFGDLINRPAFDLASRTPDPSLLLSGHMHAAMTLNFVRALVAGGFADPHRPQQWDLSGGTDGGMRASMREAYERVREELASGLRVAEALGDTPGPGRGSGVEFFTSHEAMLLEYDAAQTRTVPRRAGWYNLSTHLPWIGDRTRGLDGAHIEYARGLCNPVGVKIGPAASAGDVLALAERLNPANEAGRLVLIARFGAGSVRERLPELLHAWKASGMRGLWMCDPMHGNTRVVGTGDTARKTRQIDDILRELAEAHDIHASLGVRLGGVHLELTGADVTECVGGSEEALVRESDLAMNYATACDPRLNYQQAMEVAFILARTFRRL